MGRLLGVGHDSTLQSGVEAPRQLKRSLPRLYYCCCCGVVVVVATRADARKCLCQQSPVLIGMGSPRWQRTLRHRGVEKLALNSSTTRRSAKNASEPPKTPSHRHMTASKNNVQIFKCELRRKSGQPTRGKYVKFFQKQRRLTHAVTARYCSARRNYSKFPSVNCKVIGVHFSRGK